MLDLANELSRPAPARVALLTLLSTLACTPLQRADTLTAVGAASCGAGHSLDAAGLDEGELVAAAGCWLADWAAARADRLREAERGRVAEAEHVEHPLDPVDQAALELQSAQGQAIADPCLENIEELRRALGRCLALAE